MNKEWRQGGKRPEHEFRICEHRDCTNTVPDSRAYKLKRFCSKSCASKEWQKKTYDIDT